MRRAAKRDAIEPDIILALRQIGVQAWPVSGAGLPDLLCYHVARRRWLPLEVKSGSKTWRSRQETSAQKVSRAKGADWPIVRSVEAAVALFVAREIS